MYVSPENPVAGFELLLRNADGSETVFNQNDFSESGLSESGLSVKTEWMRKDAFLLGRIAVSGINTARWKLTQVRFPVTAFEIDETSEIFLPVNCGAVRRRLTEASLDEAPGIVRRIQMHSMQFCYFKTGKNGWYLDFRDAHWRSKELLCRREGDGLVLCALHPLAGEESGKDEFELPFLCGMRPFSGSWYEASQIYAVWGRAQKWFQKRLDTPLRKIAMWCWNRGESSRAIPPVERLSRDCRCPVALDYYWWHRNPYDTDYPNYWPPREGEQKFREIMERLNQQGIFSQVYINGLAFDMDSGDFEPDGRDGAIIREDGSIMAIPYNQFNHHRLAFMCSEAKAFQNRIAETIRRLRRTGLPGIYLDQIGGNFSNCCYHPAHSHAPGGGASQLAGYRKYIKRLRDENPGMIFSTEECSEAFMDLFDSAILVAASIERLGIGTEFEYVPAFIAVYHGAMAIYGSYALPDGVPPFDPLWPESARRKEERNLHQLYPDQFYVELGRTVIWGIQPMVANLTREISENREFHDLYRFILLTAEFYYRHRTFLFDGDMLPFGNLECRTGDIVFHHRMIFTKPEEERDIIRKMPAVLHSCWRNQNDEKALFVFNHTAEEQTFSFTWEDFAVSSCIPPRSYRMIPIR